jgi:hypothetical protein
MPRNRGEELEVEPVGEWHVSETSVNSLAKPLEVDGFAVLSRVTSTRAGARYWLRVFKRFRISAPVIFLVPVRWS